MKLDRNECKLICCKCERVIAISDGRIIEQVLCLTCYASDD